MSPIVFYLAILLECVVLIGVFTYISSLIYSSFKGSPYVPTKAKVAEELLAEANIKKGSQFLEIGCGDGRITRLAVSKFGAKGLGIDINPLLIWYAKFRTRHLPKDMISFQKKNAFDVSVNTFDTIYLFLMPELLEKLRTKFEKEHKQNALFISHGFKIDAWKKSLIKTLPGKQFSTFYYRLK